MTPSSDLHDAGRQARPAGSVTGEWGMSTLDHQPGSGAGHRLTPEGVRQLQFSRSPIGRRGYHEAEVERFRARVVHEIGQANAEKAELRQEIQRLRDYYREQRVDVDLAPSRRRAAALAAGNNDGADRHRPTVQAVNVMSQAQQVADQHIAQAEDYARRLVGTARQQYEDILVSAHEQAEQAAAEAAELYERTAPPAGAMAAVEATPGELQHLQSRVAYMRTFAQVTQVQLRSILDALRQELDQLTMLPASAPPSTSEPADRPPVADQQPAHPQLTRRGSGGSEYPDTAALRLRPAATGAGGSPPPVRTP